MASLLVVVRWIASVIRWLAVWRRFCVLLTILFISRAAFVLSVLPPFEGWDEYQHLAYVAFVVERGQSPILHEQAEVPRSLYADLVRYPHSKLAVEQLGHIGAVTYEAFWESETTPAVQPGAGGLILYQAQHSALYYRLVAPVYSLVSGADGILARVTVLRLVNVLFGAAATLIALLAVGRLVREGPPRYLLGLLIALQPLFLLNGSRVANDALAILLGTIAVYAMLILVPRRFWLGVFLGGAALGLGILAKTIVLPLVPFALFTLALLAWQGVVGRKKLLLGCLVLLGVTGGITFPYFQFNLTHFGVLSPMQEAVENHQAGRTSYDALRTAADIDWLSMFTRKYLRHSLWFGGWSWLRAPSGLTLVHQYNIYAAMLGGCLAFWAVRRREGRLFVNPYTPLHLAVLCLGVAAGLGYHAVQSKMALGSVATNSWYAAVSFPWLLCLYCQGLAYLPGRWPGRVLALGLVLTYLAAEVYGTLAVMVPKYAGRPWGPVAWERLAYLHLPGCGPGLTRPALVLTLVLVALALAVWAGKAFGEVRGGQE